MSLRDKFLAKASEFTAEPFKVCDLTVYVKPMSKGVKSRIESLASGDKTPKVCSDIRWVCLSACLVDETGAAVLTAEDRKVFDSWNDGMVEPIFEKVLEISKVTDADKEAFAKN